MCLWTCIYILNNPFAGFIVSIIKSQFPLSGSVHLCNNGTIFLAHLAYHCRSWQRRCEKSCRWTARAYFRPRSAAPGWWRWRGLGESWSTCHTETHVNANVSHFPLTLQPACNVGHKLTTHMSSMLGSVNCTNRSLSWSTPVKIQMYFLEVVVMYFLNMYLHHAEISSGCTIYYSRHVLPKATGSDLSPGVATMIWSRDSLFVSILYT